MKVHTVMSNCSVRAKLLQTSFSFFYLNNEKKKQPELLKASGIMLNNRARRAE